MISSMLVISMSITFIKIGLLVMSKCKDIMLLQVGFRWGRVNSFLVKKNIVHTTLQQRKIHFSFKKTTLIRYKLSPFG